MNIQEAYESVKKFNEIAGNLDNPNNDSLAAQLDFIQEEYIETVEDFDENNAVGILDGACDMFVTIAGFMQKLEVQGYNVEEALKRVCENNMEKYPEIGYTEEGAKKENVFQTFNNKYQLYVLKDSNGKVKKPKWFKAVDINDCVPGG